MKVRGVVLGLLLAGHSSAAVAAVTAGGEFQVNAYTTYDQSFPGACADSAGNFVVVWESGSAFPPGPGQDGSYFGVVGRRFSNNGAPVGGEFMVNTYTTDYQSFPRAACADDGRFVVVWASYEQDGDSGGIFGQRFASNGAPVGGEFRVNSYTANLQDYPSIASDAAGNVVVVWASAGQDGDTFGVFGQRFNSSGDRVGSEFRVNTYTTSAQDYPSVATSAAGAFVVVWSSKDQDGKGQGVFAQRYDSNGVPQSSEFRVNTRTAFDEDYASVAADASGNFTVVWMTSGEDDAPIDVFGQRFASNGSPMGQEFQVNTYTTGQQTIPDVSHDRSGNFVVVWTSYAQDGNTGGGIFGQRFAANGARIGAEFRANTYTPGQQYSAAVALQAADRFVVVWASEQDGNLTGVFGQRYADPTSTPTRTATLIPTLTPSATPALPTATSTRPSSRTPTRTSTGIVTEAPTATATAEPTGTDTPPPTATDTVPSATDTPPPPPSETPTSPPRTVGDCDGNGQVTINELVQGVRIVLGSINAETCGAFDRDADGTVTIGELVAAVRAALA